jgi:hypothetical protein
MKRIEIQALTVQRGAAMRLGKAIYPKKLSASQQRNRSCIRGSIGNFDILNGN